MGISLGQEGKGIHRVATVREKSLENEIFLGQGKVREFQF